VPSSNSASTRADPEGELITVVIPTRDRPSALSACLEAISRQTIAEALEVVVVADGSRDEAQIAQIVMRHTRARLVRLPASGPSAARNAGSACAHGRLVLFTDDDCRPMPDWAEMLAGALRAGAAAVAGSTINGYAGDHFAEASQIIANALVVPFGQEPRQVSFAPSNNIGCRADVVRSLPFDSSFQQPGGEDREWCARLARAGYALRLEPHAVVLHYQRLRFGSFWRQQLRYGRGAYRFRRKGVSGVPLEKPVFYAQLLRRAARHGFRVGLLVAAAQIATAIGFALEAIRPAAPHEPL
jgi:glycosyltransferase involved in cell wall biosynthesis